MAFRFTIPGAVAVLALGGVANGDVTVSVESKECAIGTASAGAEGLGIQKTADAAHELAHVVQQAMANRRPRFKAGSELTGTIKSAKQTAKGDRNTVAHEAAHVVQQRAAARALVFGPAASTGYGAEYRFAAAAVVSADYYINEYGRRMDKDTRRLAAENVDGKYLYLSSWGHARSRERTGYTLVERPIELGKAPATAREGKKGLNAVNVKLAVIERVASPDSSWQEWLAAAEAAKGAYVFNTVSIQVGDRAQMVLAGVRPLSIREYVATDAKGREELVEQMTLVWDEAANTAACASADAMRGDPVWFTYTNDAVTFHRVVHEIGNDAAAAGNGTAVAKSAKEGFPALDGVAKDRGHMRARRQVIELVIGVGTRSVGGSGGGRKSGGHYMGQVGHF